jgi:hypothetical protein
MKSGLCQRRATEIVRLRTPYSRQTDTYGEHARVALSAGTGPAHRPDYRPATLKLNPVLGVRRFPQPGQLGILAPKRPSLFGGQRRAAVDRSAIPDSGEKISSCVQSIKGCLRRSADAQLDRLGVSKGPCTVHPAGLGLRRRYPTVVLWPTPATHRAVLSGA